MIVLTPEPRTRVTGEAQTLSWYSRIIVHIEHVRLRRAPCPGDEHTSGIQMLTPGMIPGIRSSIITLANTLQR